MFAFAQLEWDQLAERSKAGMKAAADPGKSGRGRPSVTSDAEKVRQAGQHRHADLAPPDKAKLVGVVRATRMLSASVDNDIVRIVAPSHRFARSKRAVWK
jgi:DNA invertase Pin-like site-specific DNA recombinase